MIPFQLPPALARLHELIEGLHEHRERGFFLSEHDRPGDPRGRPVLMHIAPPSLSGEKGPGRHGPDWMAEALEADQESARLPRYGAAGTGEYWLIYPDRVEVHQGPQADGTYADKAVYTGDQPIRSGVFETLEVTAAALLR